MVLRATASAATCALLALFGRTAHAEPFATADQNPFLSDVLLPTPWSARLSPANSTAVSATLNWSSTALMQQNSMESLVMDAESKEWRLRIEHSFSDRLALRVQLPYRSIGAGSLDGFIDNWHSFFGLPEGARPILPQDRYAISYRRNGAASIDEQAARSGVGNLRVEAGYQLTATPKRSSALWIAMQLPTSEHDAPTNRLWGAAIGVAGEQTLSSRWRAMGQAAAIVVEPGDVLPDRQRNWLAHGVLAFDYLASPALTLTVQLEGHSAAFKDTALGFLGNAWIFAIGGDYRFANRWRVQFGVSEDVKVEASPDVTFIFNLSRSWR